MTQPAVRNQYRYNALIQYWDPCTDPARDPFGPIALTRHADPPAAWPQSMVAALDRVRESRVGRAIIRHIRLRTTFYPGSRAQADVDLYELDDSRGAGSVSRVAATQRARTVGYPARIFVDPSLQASRNAEGLLQAAEISLAHELFHALNITHGSSRLGTHDDLSERCRAPSTEEAYAVVLENMFRSEMRYCARRTYLDTEPVASCQAPTSVNTGIPLTALERRMVLFYRNEVPAFAGELSGISEVTCPYNPFWATRNEPTHRLAGRSPPAPRHALR